MTFFLIIDFVGKSKQFHRKIFFQFVVETLYIFEVPEYTLGVSHQT